MNSPKIFENTDVLEMFLRDKPRYWSAAIASRAAMRVLPVWWEWTHESAIAKQRGLTALPVIRALILSSAVANRPPVDMLATLSDASAEADNDIATLAVDTKGPVNAAARAASCAAAAAAGVDLERIANAIDASAAAAAAASAVRAAVAAVEKNAADIWAEVKRDFNRLDSGEDVMRDPLWSDGDNPFEYIWSHVKAIFSESEWKVFVNWYDAELKGNYFPRSWLFEIACTDAEHWRQSPHHIAGFSLYKFPSINFLASEGVESFGEGLGDGKIGNGLGAGDLNDARRELRLLDVAISEQRKTIGEQKRSLDELMESASHIRAQIGGWMEEIETRFESRVHAATEALEQQAVFKEPVKLWEEKEAEHSRRKSAAFSRFVSSLVILGVSLVAICAFIIYRKDLLLAFYSKPGCDAKSLAVECSMGGVFEFLPILVVLTLVTLALWYIRLQMKEFLSERHLELDARERRAFAEAYISLVATGEASDEIHSQRAIVYASLFRPSTDGMVKDEGGVDPSIGAAISKILSR